MASRASEVIHEHLSQATLQLKKYEPEPWCFRGALPEKEPRTPSEWFSYKFPRQAAIYGTPFIELVEHTGDGFDRINPLSLNIDFFASILGGDSRLGHKVVYIEMECAFYYYDPRDHLYKAVSEDKLGNLMRALMIRCAEELGNDVHKLNLFLEFRKDATIRSIVHRAKSILAADDSFFAVDSKYQRKQGPELYERVARQFVEQVLERQAGERLLLTDAYESFLQYLKRKNMPPVKRKQFKDLVPPAIEAQFELGVRNDIKDDDGSGWHCGWKGIHALDLQPAGQDN